MSKFHYSENNFVRCCERRPQQSNALGEYLVLDFTATSEL